MSDRRGMIFSEEAYAQGKMLDHSSWQSGNPCLVRGITGSDVDAAFDNDGRIIFAELSTSCDSWDQLSIGQRRLYEACIKGGAHCAVLLKHRISPENHLHIDTRNHIDSYQVMLWDHSLVFSKIIEDNLHWQRFVVRWINDPDGPLRLRRQIISASLKQNDSPACATHAIREGKQFEYISGAA